MNEKINETVNEYAGFLNEKYKYLSNVKLFLVGVPDLFSKGEITELEFQNFLEKYEMETVQFLSEKNWYQERIAEQLNIKKEQFNFKLLVKLGYREFDDIGRKVLRISNEINYYLVKISIYMKNFLKMQQDFFRLNNFLYQKDYTPKGVENSYRPGKNFYGEA